MNQIVKEILPTIPARLVSPLRVAAYCRVSTHLKQEGSLNTQSQYFRRTIKKNPRWICAGIFCDVKSGRNSNRPGFMRLLRKCDNGKIDMIVIKSMSRFTRNTLDALNVVRHLKDIGVDVFFEKENIHTLDETGELLFSVFAALVQSECFNISENVKWGIERSIQNPDSKFYSRPCYGYRRTPDGKGLVIFEEEASIVRLIFQLRNSGFGYRKIQKALKERGIPSPSGKPQWSTETIKKTLLNEKYHGDVFFFKHFRKEYPAKREKKNHGEHAMYLCSNHHPAIISDRMGKTI